VRDCWSAPICCGAGTSAAGSDRPTGRSGLRHRRVAGLTGDLLNARSREIRLLLIGPGWLGQCGSGGAASGAAEAGGTW
jgi:hypothetical protein